MRNKGLGALVLSVVGIALVMPSAALAAKPGATSGAAANVTFQSARVNGSVDPNNEPTNYYFQYGTTAVYGTETPMVPAGGGANAVRVSTDIGGLAPATRYHYRIVAVNASGTTAGRHRTFTTRRQPLGVSLAATPNPIAAGKSTVLAGTLTGTGNAGRRIVLQSSPWPYTAGFQNAANEQITNAQGGFSFPVLSVPFNTQYRVQMPERAGVFSPIVTAGVKPYVKTKVGKRRVRRGGRIRFSGTVIPAGTGAQIAFQKKRRGNWVTVGGTIVRSGGRYSKRLKIRRGGTFRVWTGVANQQYTPNHGRSVKIRTFR